MKLQYVSEFTKAKDGCTAKEIGFLNKMDGTYTDTKEESFKALLKVHFPAATI